MGSVRKIFSSCVSNRSEWMNKRKVYLTHKKKFLWIGLALVLLVVGCNFPKFSGTEEVSDVALPSVGPVIFSRNPNLVTGLPSMTLLQPVQ